MLKHDCCWHNAGAEEENGPGGYVNYRVCCHCGTRQRECREDDSAHGPHAPNGSVPKVVVWRTV